MADAFTSQLARFSCAPFSASGAARLVTSLSVLDWLAVGLAGAEEPVARIVRGLALDDGGAGQAHVFGDAARVPVRAAALVNGTTAHALDYDDTHFAHIGHPSAVVISTALAMAEARDAPLVHMLEAALTGMELSIRVGIWLGRSHYQAGFHQTATAGAFGAAAAAGRLAGLNEGQMAHALGLTATRAAGLKAQFGTMGKPYNAGQAAAAGAEAALLAARGFEANPAAMEGDLGFCATHHGDAAASTALEGLGEVWLFETVSHKFHACCHGLHAALEAGRELDTAAPEIAALTVTVHPRWMTVCNQPAPETGLGAKFSFRTVLAMQALGFDTALPGSYSAATCSDPRLVALRQLIEVHEDDELGETEAVVEVLRRDGSRMSARHDLQAPMKLADREDRVRAKATALIGRETADEAWTQLRTGGSAAGFARLVAGAAKDA